MSIETMKLALEALEDVQEAYGNHSEWFKERVDALRAAIEQAEKQEPVAWKYETPMYVSLQWKKMDDWREGTWTALYTAPPQREWQGLTDEEVGQLIPGYAGDASGVDLYWLITEIEAKLKEKNT